MPGTIKVSVLQLMDPTSSSLSSDARTGELSSLKVAMGKREYQRWGNGDLSFPVKSLREDLILTLYDAEGSEIFRTDVQTLLVAEKEFWDTSFQLEGGRCVQLKLQFLLTEVERKRVQDMRESVLKRRHEQLLKSGPSHSVPDFTEKTTGGKTPSAATEILRERRLQNLLDNSCNASGSSLVAPLSQELQVNHGCSDQRVVPHLPKVYKQTIEAQLSQSDICQSQAISEDSQLGSGSIMSGNVAANAYVASTKSEEYGTRGSKKKISLEKKPGSTVKKMISALERSQFQGIGPLVGPTPKLKLRKIEMQGSLNESWLEKTNTENLKIGQTIAKSFSSGMLSEMSSKQSPEYNNFVQVEKLGERKQIDLPINRDTTMTMMKHVELKSNWRFTNLYEEANDIVERVKTKETASLDGKTESVEEWHEPLFYDKLKSVFEIINRRNTTMKGDKDPGHGPGSDVGHAVESKIKGGDVLEESWLSRVEKPLNIDGEYCRSRSSVDDIDELSACRDSNAKLILVNCFEFEQWLLGGSGSWKLRHLCITTGSKQLKDLINGFGVHVETSLAEGNITRSQSDEELMIQGETCTEGIESEKISSDTPSFVDISRINGGLIEQVVRVAILMVACGTLLLNAMPIIPRFLCNF